MCFITFMDNLKANSVLERFNQDPLGETALTLISMLPQFCEVNFHKWRFLLKHDPAAGASTTMGLQEASLVQLSMLSWYSSSS